MKLAALFVPFALGTVVEDEVLLQSSKQSAGGFRDGLLCTANSDCTSRRCSGSLECDAAATDSSDDTCKMFDDMAQGRGANLKNKIKAAACNSPAVQAVRGGPLSNLPQGFTRIVWDIVKKKEVCMDITINSAKTDFSQISAAASTKVSLSVAGIKLASADFSPLVNSAIKALLPTLSNKVESKVDNYLLTTTLTDLCVPFSKLKGGNFAGKITYGDVKQLLDQLKQDNTRKDFFNTALIPFVNQKIAAKLADIHGLSVKKEDSSDKCTRSSFVGCLCRTSQAWSVTVTSMTGLGAAVKINPFTAVDQSGASGACLENCQLSITGGVTATNIRAKGSTNAWYKACGSVPKAHANGGLDVSVNAQAGLALTATYSISGR